MKQAPPALGRTARLEEVQAVRRRMAQEDWGHLAWAIRFAQQNLEGMTAGDWYNLRLELAAFGSGREGEEVPLLSDDEVRHVHQEFARIVSTLLRDGKATIGPIQFEIVVDRKPEAEKDPFLMFSAVRNLAPLSTTYAITFSLGMYLARFAHRVRACPAPASRGAKGELCGRWFVAKRRNQAYCSRRCQSRATTRAVRERQAKKKRPPMTGRRRRTAVSLRHRQAESLQERAPTKDER